MLFFEHRLMIFRLASFVRFSHRSNTVLLCVLLLVLGCCFCFSGCGSVQ